MIASLFETLVRVLSSIAERAGFVRWSLMEDFHRCLVTVLRYKN